MEKKKKRKEKVAIGEYELRVSHKFT